MRAGPISGATRPALRLPRIVDRHGAGFVFPTGDHDRIKSEGADGACRQLGDLPQEAMGEVDQLGVVAPPGSRGRRWLPPSQASAPLDSTGGRQSAPRRIDCWQRQRVAIARALLKRPKALIFDEAISNLDQQTADLFAQTISRLRARLRAAHSGLTPERALDAGAMGGRLTSRSCSRRKRANRDALAAALAEERSRLGKARQELAAARGVGVALFPWTGWRAFDADGSE
jgi:hypothetical protein